MLRWNIVLRTLLLPVCFLLYAEGLISTRPCNYKTYPLGLSLSSQDSPPTVQTPAKRDSYRWPIHIRRCEFGGLMPLMATEFTCETPLHITGCSSISPKCTCADVPKAWEIEACYGILESPVSKECMDGIWRKFNCPLPMLDPYGHGWFYVDVNQVYEEMRDACQAMKRNTNPPGFCRDSGDCQAGYECRRHQCWKSITNINPSGFCRDSGDCGPGYMCRMHTCWKEITNPSPYNACNDENDCPGDQTCINGRCGNEEQQSQCKDENDCPGDLVCNHGTCSDENNAEQCKSENDCPGDQVCNHGTCSDENNTEQCKSENDCPGDQVCSDGTCSSENNIDQCKSENDCSGDQICNHGVCIDEDSANRCKSENDCPGYQVCNQGICSDEKNTNQCESENDCPGDQVCNHGTCSDENSADQCKNENDCPGYQVCNHGICSDEKNTNQCRSENDCPGDQVCNHGTCSEDNTVNQCKSENDCPEDQICNHGICSDAKNTDQCKSENDCPGDQVCNEDICSDEQKSEQCRSENDCPGEHVCDNGTCSSNKNTGQCKTENDCPDDQVCNNGACSGESNASQCKRKKDCPDDQVCNNGTCSDDKNTGQCKSEEDCPDDQACNIGTCSGDKNADQCKSENDCPEDQVCNNGTCSSDKKHAQCQTDADCPQDTVCNDGTCREMVNEKQCTQEDDCRNGQTCRNGTCSDIELKKCRNNGECGSKQVCINGSCTNQLIDEPQCTSNRDCGRNEKCKKGKCKSDGGGFFPLPLPLPLIPGFPPAFSPITCLPGYCLSPWCPQCNNNEKKYDPPSKKEYKPSFQCKKDQDCLGDKICLQNICKDPGVDGCKSDDECFGNMACRNRICTGCLVDTDCPGSLLCRSKQCVSCDQLEGHLFKRSFPINFIQKRAQSCPNNCANHDTKEWGLYSKYANKDDIIKIGDRSTFKLNDVWKDLKEQVEDKCGSILPDGSLPDLRKMPGSKTVSRAVLCKTENTGPKKPLYVNIYNTDTMMAEMSIYRLDPANLKSNGKDKRQKFYQERGLNRNLQPNRQSNIATVNGQVVQYDRGHLFPNSAVNIPSQRAATFSYMNQVPMHKATNQHGSWRSSERLLSYYTKSVGRQVWVVSGTWVSPTAKASGLNVGVPTHMYQVACDIIAGSSIGFWAYNDPDDKAHGLGFRAHSVKFIEQRIGFKIFPDDCSGGKYQVDQWFEEAEKVTSSNCLSFRDYYEVNGMAQLKQVRGCQKITMDDDECLEIPKSPAGIQGRLDQKIKERREKDPDFEPSSCEESDDDYDKTEDEILDDDIEVIEDGRKQSDCMVELDRRAHLDRGCKPKRFSADDSCSDYEVDY
ncbi:hypothetical protein K7432_012303 [Basidiobolus ranarum]|uniref:Uncharacterized protein n=1 Tax=Basidiobolus ranarum TaxID=34480 RepID=A0ABR2VSH5_9FUNG